MVDLLQQGGIVVVPTDTLYAFACSMEHKRAVETIAQLKGFSLKKAKYSMICSSCLFRMWVQYTPRGGILSSIPAQSG